MLVGKTGIVIDETKHMLIVEIKGSRKQIPKNVITFQIMGKNNQEKIIEGKKITKQMYNRIKG